MDTSKPVGCNVLMCADDPEVKTFAKALVQETGLVAIDAGPLANSVVSEAWTSVLIYRNKTCEVPASGIRIAGLP